MCGIAGLVGMCPQKHILADMMDTMRRRGPDGNGIFQEGDTCLLHTRLAVIDPEGGAQPMALSLNGEEYVLVYNGELYNTEELRRELTKLGHNFRGHSDTEVLLHAYARFGEDCLPMLNGIYAFAVWEKKSGRLFLARDRIGVKPLFYAWEGSRLIFASEIKTLLAAGISPVLDGEGAAQLLSLGPGRLPGSGILRGIRELEPGCCGWFEDGVFRWRRYWYLKDREHTETFEETVEKVRYLVTDAIKRQMVSDVPIGTFLSGGLDSSIITAICANTFREQGKQLPTFSVDYQNNRQYFVANKYQPESDETYIRIMADTFGTEQYQTVLSPEELVQALEAATFARDLPGMADVDTSLLCFCGKIRSHVTVAMSGECADEIFGGYPWYRDPEVRAREGFPWAQNTRQRASLIVPDVKTDLTDFAMDAYRKTCRESDILPGQNSRERRMKEMVNLNFRHFMQTLLDRKDRMSMYHSLEVRVPFCDHRIAEYLYGVPWEFKDYQGKEKGLLRCAVADLLPLQICTRKKSPYPKTFDPRYESLILEQLEVCMQEDSPLWHIIRKDALRKLLEEESPWPWYGQLMRRPQMATYFLQLDYWLKYYRIAFAF